MYTIYTSVVRWIGFPAPRAAVITAAAGAARAGYGTLRGVITGRLFLAPTTDGSAVGAGTRLTVRYIGARILVCCSLHVGRYFVVMYV